MAHEAGEAGRGDQVKDVLEWASWLRALWKAKRDIDYWHSTCPDTEWDGFRHGSQFLTDWIEDVLLLGRVYEAD